MKASPIPAIDRFRWAGHEITVIISSIYEVIQITDDLSTDTQYLKSMGITAATTSGTCTATYVTALTLSCARVRNKTIIVVNTHATLTMKYRIRGYAKSGSSYYNEIQAEATLAASTSQPHVIENSYDVITVEVIDGSGHATYAIDYCGGQ